MAYISANICNDSFSNISTSLVKYSSYFFIFMAFPDLALLGFRAAFFLAPRAAPFLPLALLGLATSFLAPIADFLAPTADFLAATFFPADAPLVAFFPAFILAAFFGALAATFPKPCFCWVLSFLAAALATSAMRLFSS